MNWISVNKLNLFPNCLKTTTTGESTEGTFLMIKVFFCNYTCLTKYIMVKNTVSSLKYTFNNFFFYQHFYDVWNHTEWFWVSSIGYKKCIRKKYYINKDGISYINTGSSFAGRQLKRLHSGEPDVLRGWILRAIRATAVLSFSKVTSQQEYHGASNTVSKSCIFVPMT